MIDFKAIKGLATAREVAEHYGLTVRWDLPTTAVRRCASTQVRTVRMFSNPYRFFNGRDPPFSRLRKKGRFTTSQKMPRNRHVLSPPSACGGRDAEIPMRIRCHHLRQMPT